MGSLNQRCAEIARQYALECLAQGDKEAAQAWMAVVYQYDPPLPELKLVPISEDDPKAAGLRWGVFA